ncbi:cysteine protease StiP domain-containing protein [Deinococcus sedimenti]|uniref:PELOTA RNA-binding domain-containing protein n=1 Tax=Deinococcus sedimenti TaxID=1867090 RepID=A0ABQ2S741_9DEIO|nr:cysteine protease StiP domain-containing protein [Deinococcus sedimenti]GGS03721.1 hypothetical protein GCM10008960_32820 [Deinococcus sedimenti]
MNHSFPPGDVTFHLNEGTPQWVSVAEKERLLREGTSYATLLTPEAEPVWGGVFDAVLPRLAARTAGLVEQVTAQIAAHHVRPVLISLARGGTPAGALIRRAAARRGLDWPHHSLSIMRAEGLDLVAYQEVLALHPEREVIFVDGWTGKGSIRGALERSVPQARLAVLSDPAGISTYAGTYQDVLIPHALLNATVCGLLSRTFLSGPGRHAAQVELNLGTHDRTQVYLDAVNQATPQPVPPGPRPDAPFVATYALAAQYGVTDPHRVKPSVGEACRVLLRRAPHALLLRQAGYLDTRHLEQHALAHQIPVHVHADLPYQACALIQ